MHAGQLVFSGIELGKSTKALIMVHGRGSSAADILSVSSRLDVRDFTLIAPQATGHSWYPHSFLAPPAENEPWLSSALGLLQITVDKVKAAGIPPEAIFFFGFSQGACLVLEFVTRKARRWGGVVACTGGLIGDRIYSANYRGNFDSTPVFIGTSDPDHHVPVERVKATHDVIRSMNGMSTLEIYPNMGHTISIAEIAAANRILSPVAGQS